MVERETVRSLLDTIERRLNRLQEASDLSIDDYVEDQDVQDIVERNFELAIQACINLGLHLLADEPTAPPETNREVFRELAALDLIDDELSRRLEEMAGFRNVLAHEYARVVPELVHENLDRLDDLREFVRELLPRLRHDGVLE